MGGEAAVSCSLDSLTFDDMPGDMPAARSRRPAGWCRWRSQIMTALVLLVSYATDNRKVPGPDSTTTRSLPGAGWLADLVKSQPDGEELSRVQTHGDAAQQLRVRIRQHADEQAEAGGGWG